MPFGYVPDRIASKNLFFKVLGYPSMIRRIQAPVIIRMLEPLKSETILDAGCGRGFFAYELSRRCNLSIGVDWNPGTGLSLAIDNVPRLAYLRSDVQTLPFNSEQFDKILLSSVLQMVKDDRALLRECHRVLKRKGMIVLSVPTEYQHVKRLNLFKSQLKKKFGALGKAYYKLSEVIRLLREAGFEVVEMEYSPKKWGSLIYEVGLFLWYYLGFPFFNPLLFPLFYSLAYLDRFASRKQTGNEIVLSAWKVSR